MATLTKCAARAGATLRTVGVQGVLWADAGGSAVHELAFGLATGADYLRALADRRVGVDEAAQRCLFTFALGSWCYEEIAKLHAARQLWARLVAAQGGGADAQKMLVHGRIAHGVWSSADPQADLRRVAGEIFAGVAGGCACIHAETAEQAPEDWRRRVQESVGACPDGEGLCSCGAEPVDGGCRVAALTQQLVAQAWALFVEVETYGGMAAAICAGFPQAQVEKYAEERRGTGGTRRAMSTPVEVASSAAFALHRAREAATLRRSERAASGREILERLGENQRANARTKMAALVEAFACGATLGEAARALYDGGTEVPPIKPLRLGRG